MTLKEIKKGLEICADGFPCNDCPYDDNFGKCIVRLKEDALSLIIKQEKEIAELKAAKNDWKQRYESLDQRYMALVASSVECMDKKVKKAKIDVLNELRETYAMSGSVGSGWATIVLVDNIDELIKRCENEQ